MCTHYTNFKYEFKREQYYPLHRYVVLLIWWLVFHFDIFGWTSDFFLISTFILVEWRKIRKKVTGGEVNSGGGNNNY